MWVRLYAVSTPVLLAVGVLLIGDPAEYRLIGVNQTWTSIYAGVHAAALLFRRRYRRLASAAAVWLTKPVLLLFALLFYTVGVAVNNYVFVVDSLTTALVVSASLPAVGYISSALRRKSVDVCRRSRRSADVARPTSAPVGVDLASSNCLLAVAVLRLALDQPEADLASAVPLWLLMLHPLPLVWYWAEANVRRNAKKRDKAGLGRNGNGSSGRRRYFGLAGKLLSVSITGGKMKANSSGGIQPQTVERITVV